MQLFGVAVRLDRSERDVDPGIGLGLGIDIGFGIDVGLVIGIGIGLGIGIDVGIGIPSRLVCVVDGVE